MGWWSALDYKLVEESSLSKGGSQWKYPLSTTHIQEGFMGDYQGS